MAKGRMGSNPSVLLTLFIHHYFSLGNNFWIIRACKKLIELVYGGYFAIFSPLYQELALSWWGFIIRIGHLRWIYHG